LSVLYILEGNEISNEHFYVRVYTDAIAFYLEYNLRKQVLN
jgi:hypothetical protein